MATPPFGKIFGVMSGQSLGTRVSNLMSVALTVLELLTFNCHDWPLRTHTHTHTHRQTDKHKRTHYLCHSLRSLGGDNKNIKVIIIIFVTSVRINVAINIRCLQSSPHGFSLL